MNDTNSEVVNDKNIRFISMLLGGGKGSVVYANGWSFDRFFILLCRTAKIKKNTSLGSELVTPQNHRLNRGYSMTPIPYYKGNLTGALESSLFNRLDIGSGYRFSINPLCYTSLSPVLRDNSRAVYVHQNKRIHSALKSQFDYSITRLNSRLKEMNRTQIDPLIVEQKIMPYVAEDLRTGATLRNNISAGIEADMLCGM